VGLAWAFTNNWSAGIEYDHYDFGTHSVTLTDPNGAPVPIAPVSGPVSVKQQIDTVRFTLNYHL
jgi:opacity protein-like surface antigen